MGIKFPNMMKDKFKNSRSLLDPKQDKFKENFANYDIFLEPVKYLSGMKIK